MPKFLVPRHSTVHRFACRSLYHALLRVSSSLRSVELNPDVTKNIIRRQFRKFRGLQSPTQVLNSLKAGYEAVDLLHSCSQGNPQSILRLHTLTNDAISLSVQVAAKRKAQSAMYIPHDRTIKSARRKAEGRANRRPQALRPHPEVESILSRPRAKVRGIRRVPAFVIARGLPFLRIKKPQPSSLSRALKSILDKRWKRILRRDRLQDELFLAEHEDQWDEILSSSAASGDNCDGSLSWKISIQQSLIDTQKALEKGDRDTAQRAKKLWNIVLKERELAERESEERATLTHAVKRKGENSKSEDFDSIDAQEKQTTGS